MKFKKGDRVMVKMDNPITKGVYAGKGGVITKVNRAATFPYSIDLKPTYIHLWLYIICYE